MGPIAKSTEHHPEWYHHVVGITRDDVEEYLALVLRILDDWKGGGVFCCTLLNSP
jgi:hypothetical protein